MRRELHSISPIRDAPDRGMLLMGHHPHAHSAAPLQPYDPVVIPQLQMQPHPQAAQHGTHHPNHPMHAPYVSSAMQEHHHQISTPPAAASGRFREISPEAEAERVLLGGGFGCPVQSPQQRDEALLQRAGDVVHLQNQLADLFRSSLQGGREPPLHLVEDIQRVQASLAAAARTCEEVATSPIADLMPHGSPSPLHPSPEQRVVSPAPRTPPDMASPSPVPEPHAAHAPRALDAIVADALRFACQRRPLVMSVVQPTHASLSAAYVAQSARDPRLQFLVAPCSLPSLLVDHDHVEYCLQASDRHQCAGVVMVVPHDASVTDAAVNTILASNVELVFESAAVALSLCKALDAVATAATLGYQETQATQLG